MSCSARRCTNRAPAFKLHRFPKNPDIRKKWAENVNRPNWEPNENSRLCEEHFEADDFLYNNHGQKQRLKKGSIPSLFSYLLSPLSNPRKSRDDWPLDLDLKDPLSLDTNPRDHTYSQKNDPNVSEITIKPDPVLDMSDPQEEESPEMATETNLEMNYSFEVPTTCHKCHSFEKEAKMWKSKFERSDMSNKLLRKQLRMDKQTIKRLEKRLQKSS